MNKRDRSRSPGSPQLAHAHLHLQAHEANLVKGQDSLAATVEYSAASPAASSSSSVKGKKTALIRWQAEDLTSWLEDEAAFSSAEGRPSQDEIWVDRFDILNLLTSLPSPASRPASPALSVGFSELGSDHEEMFFFDQREQEQISQQRKRRRMEDNRAARLRILEAEERAARGEEEESEPSETQLALMTKLAQTLAASSDPSMLEMRILANHGSDKRFSFLRKGGKWAEEWKAIKLSGGKAEEKVVEGGGQAAAAYGGGVLSLVAYDDSSSDEDEVGPQPTAPQPSETAPAAAEGAAAGVVDGDELRKKEAKAEKARLWAEKRRLAREAAAVSEGDAITPQA